MLGLASLVQAQSVNTGNVVVSRVGNGTTALSANTAPVTLLEFSKLIAGQAVPVSTLPLNSTTKGGRLTLGGSTLYEGQLQLSSDGRFISLIGYDAPAAEASSSTGLSGITVSNGGSGYNYASPVTITGGGGTGATATVNFHVNGAINQLRITNSGSGYTSAPTITVDGGTGFTGSATRVPYWQGLSGKKVVAKIDGLGMVDYSTSFPNSFLGGGIVKNALTTDGSQYWVNTARMEYVTLGQTSEATQIVNAGPRSAGVFNNQLFYLLGFNANGMVATNPALPDAPATTSSVGLPLTSSTSPMGFVFFDLDPNISWNNTGLDVVYVAEVNNGLEKYYYNGTAWVAANSRFGPTSGPLNNVIQPAGVSVSALAGEVNNLGQPVIYALGGNSIAANNSLFSIADASGRTGTMTVDVNTTVLTLATAGANYSFKGVSLSPTIGTLPVRLTSFAGMLINGNARLNWSAASEAGVKSYIIERSANGSDFTAIGTVSAKGVNQQASYMFDDLRMNNGRNYYRLKVVDTDGSFKYGNVVVITPQNANLVDIKIFPNPVKNVLTISHPIASATAFVKIMNASGAVISTYKVAENATQLSLDASAFVKGMYFIQFVNDGKITTRQFVK